MAVDLLNLVDPLKREVMPPGADLFPDGTDDDFLGALTNAFWEIRLYGLVAGFEENAAARGGPAQFSDGIVTPLHAASGYDAPSGWSSTDMGRELQQLIVLWAGWKVVLARMGSLNTLFRARAGPVEYEVQNAASVLKTILDQLKAQINLVIHNLSSYGASTSAVVFDSIVERSYSQAVGDVWWVR
jgi:hypothetical protein